MSNYIIVGTGGHGRVVLSYLERNGVPKNNIAFVDLFKKKQTSISECPIIGDLSEGMTSPFDKTDVVVAYGGDPYTGNRERQVASETFEDIASFDYRFSVIKDPSAIIVESAIILDNVSIGMYSIIGTNSKVGKGVIINNKAVIEHDVTVGDYTNISPGALILGGVTLGERVFIGAGSIVRDDVSIGTDTVVGMGALVTKDIPPKCVVIGNPARIVKEL